MENVATVGAKDAKDKKQMPHLVTAALLPALISWLGTIAIALIKKPFEELCAAVGN